jgi:N-acetylglucosaminyldiphosphoundecaprenol N-acetyl-beta-D-mannosaminyltransferase
MMDAIEILNVKIDRCSVKQLHTYIGNVIVNNNKAIVANVNVHAMNLSYEKPWFRAFLNQSQVVFCDGFGVILGARLLGHHLPRRITYADWIWDLSSPAEAHGWTIFFLGAKPGVANTAANQLLSHYPDLKICGIHHGYFNMDPSSDENKSLIEKINSCRPNILLLGLGMPRQERWLHENWDAIDANIALTGGAVFDYASGKLTRGPKWLTDHGLEWLARLLIEPRRLWRRYLIGNPRFIWRVLKERFRINQSI